MSESLITALVLGGVQFFVALIMLRQTWLTRQILKTNRSVYLEGRIRVTIVPRGAKGLLNLRIENTGLGGVHDVRLTFPFGLRVLVGSKPSFLVPPGKSLDNLGTMCPHEKREWHIGATHSKNFAELGDQIPYTLKYRHPTSNSETIAHGSLRLHSYQGNLIRAFANDEDLLDELRAISTSLVAIAKGIDS